MTAPRAGHGLTAKRFPPPSSRAIRDYVRGCRATKFVSAKRRYRRRLPCAVTLNGARIRLSVAIRPG